MTLQAEPAIASRPRIPRSSSQEKRTRSENKDKVAVPGNQGPRLVRTVTIQKPASELYAFWRDVKNLELIAEKPITITPLSATESHWKIAAPVGSLEWDSLVINEDLNQLIAWRSREGAQLRNAGSVRFAPAPGDQGTEVTVAVEFDSPGGKLGNWIAKLSGDGPGRQITRALRRLKALMETGEIPTTQGQSVGRPQSEKGGE